MCSTVNPNCNSTATVPGLWYDPELASSWRNDSESASNGSGWVANKGDREYIHFRLEEVWQINTLAIMPTTNWYTKTFRVMFSNDALVWTPYNSQSSRELFGEVFTTDRGNVTLSLDPPIQARYISINPLTFDGYPALKAAMSGCPLEIQPLNTSTNGSADIRTETVWIPNQSPIIIDRLISVYSSGYLTIQAGVSVVFINKEAGLRVYGTLNSSGLAGVGVLFTSNDSISVNDGKWAGISVEYGGARLRGGSSTNITDGVLPDETFMIRDSAIVYNNRGVTIQGTIENPTFYFKGSKFSNNANSGINSDNTQITNSDFKTNLVVKDCYFGHNKYFAIMRVYETQLWRLDVDTCTFESNGCGILTYFYNPFNDLLDRNQVSVRNSHFLNSNRTEYRSFHFTCTYNCKTDTISIVNNTFGNNVGGAIYIQNQNDDYRANIIVYNNIIRNEAISTYAGLDLDTYSSVYIRNNIFINLPAGIAVAGNNKGINAEISQNVFSKIHGTRAVVIVTATQLIFTDNIVNDSTVSVMLDIVDGFDHVVANNTFVNNTLSSCYIRIGEEYHANMSVVFDYNFWDTIHIDTIKSKICDFFLDASKARAKIANFYSTVDMTTVVNSVNNDEFKVYYSDASVYIVGGVITGHQQLPSLEGRTVIFNRSIIIEETAALTVSDVTVNITENRITSTNDIMQIYTCSSHVSTYVFNSTLAAGIYKNGLNFHSQSISGDWIQNIIGTADTFFHIQFCDSHFEENNVSRKLQINGNRFYAVRSRIDIFIQTYRSHTKAKNHTFYISNNIFTSEVKMYRKMIYINLPIDENLHSFFVHNNTFINATETALYVNGGAQHVIITNNTFMNNSVCIQTNLLVNNMNGYYNDRKFTIADNRLYNNDAEGIINIRQFLDFYAHVQLYINDFSDNSGIMLLLNLPNITIKNNYFDNKNAQYNIKSLEKSVWYHEPTIDATLNYWGTTNVSKMASKIHDVTFDGSLMEIVYIPYLASKNFSDILGTTSQPTSTTQNTTTVQLTTTTNNTTTTTPQSTTTTNHTTITTAQSITTTNKTTTSTPQSTTTTNNTTTAQSTTTTNNTTTVEPTNTTNNTTTGQLQNITVKATSTTTTTEATTNTTTVQPTKSQYITTVNSTNMTPHTTSSKTSITSKSTISKSTTTIKGSITTSKEASTAQSMATPITTSTKEGEYLANNSTDVEAQDGPRDWVVPTAVTLAALVLVVIVAFGIVYAVRKHSSFSSSDRYSVKWLKVDN